MSKKWIPNSDIDFVTMAENFARQIAKDPQRFEVAPDDVEVLTSTVAQFRQTLQAAQFGSRSQSATEAKKLARQKAEKIIRRLGNLIRASEKLDAATKICVNIRQRSTKGKVLTCPTEPPRLRFTRALHESGAVPVHELKFSTLHFEQNKPEGAVRLELFVDLIPPDEPIPAHPGANHGGVQGGRPWYLRSYTKSPIKLIPPMARVPMRIVYWGRWADSVGNVGPFSATAAAWIEGGSPQCLPGGVGISFGHLGGPKPVPILEDARPIGPESRNESYRVALLQVQIESYGVQANAALPEPEQREMRQIEGPEREAA